MCEQHKEGIAQFRTHASSTPVKTSPNRAGKLSARLGGLLDRLDLLAQHSENHHQLGVVELLLLTDQADSLAQLTY